MESGADLGLARRGTEQVSVSVLWLHPEELEESGRPRLRSHPHLLETPLHLRDDHGIGILCRDPTVTPEHVQHWKIRDGTAIGNTRPGDIGHPVWLETPAKLI